MKRFKSGQSTLEYVIILAAVVAAIILIAGYVKNNLTNGYQDLGNSMQNRISNGFGDTTTKPPKPPIIVDI